MPRFTRVYCEFIGRLDEVSLLRKKAAALERSSRSLLHGAEIRALCRSAVVLLSSHIEAYIKELGELALDSAHQKKVPRSRVSPQFFYYVSRERIEGIRGSTQPDSIAKSIQEFVLHELPNWHGTGPIHGPISSESFSSGFSNPRFERVKSYFSRFGYNEFRRDFMKVKGARGTPLETSINTIVNTRNSIAHGDPSATKTPSEVREMEENAKEFCRAVDHVFSEWCKRSLCGIR
jgi:hypothetical protein